jgi:5'-deoxynucleotidase YfbR-like HD superfamily hydrolase
MMETGDSAKRYVIDTASGVRLVLDNPRQEDILIEDVAGGLSKVCRFGAHPLEYYSVAQHALLVRRLVVESGYPELALAALHHDSHEAYLCDIPSPLKSKIFTATQIYDDICRRFDRTIAEAFDLEYPEKGSEEKAIIKQADNRALLIEAARLLPDGGKALRRDLELEGEDFRDLPPLEDPLSPIQVQELFLRAYTGLVRRAMR